MQEDENESDGSDGPGRETGRRADGKAGSEMDRGADGKAGRGPDRNRRKTDPRGGIVDLVMRDDLEELLLRAGELHGHFCSYLSMGVKAGALALKEMGPASDGMENLLAIIETNNCFSDGVQFSTACSFGNNALIYRDLGKTAVTFTRRDGRGLRISVRPDARKHISSLDEGLSELFEKVVRDRAGTEEEMREFKERSTATSLGILDLEPKKVFKIEEVDVEVPDFAPIFDSVICEDCGESVMASRIVRRGDEALCRSCAGSGYLEMDGSGLSHRPGTGTDVDRSQD